MKYINIKRNLTIAFITLLLTGFVFGIGLVTNSNQSAEYIRMLNRNASLGIDAAYFNPAGLVLLSDGFHLSLSSQTLVLNQKVKSHFETLNASNYKGDVRAWVFPDIHLVYKLDKLAFSGSLMPIGGGGGGIYDDGLPSFEYPYAGWVGQPVADFSLSNTDFGIITGYNLETEFKGASVYFAGQANVAYAVNDMLSLAVGGRVVGAYNKLEGSITGIGLTTSSGNDLTSSSIDNLSDMVMEVTQTDIGFTGIISMNLMHMDHMNIGLRYEFATPLELETKNDNPDAQHFRDGEKTNADMPAMLGLGVSYQVVPMMRVEGSFNYFFNKSVNWDGVEEALDNGFEAGVGVEHSMGSWLASIGYLYSKTGATTSYRNDARMALDHHGIGFGVGYKLSDAMTINVGVLALIFIEDDKTLPAQNNALIPHEIYNELGMGFTIGVNYHL